MPEITRRKSRNLSHTKGKGGDGVKRGRFWLLYWSAVMVFACSPVERVLPTGGGAVVDLAGDPPLVALTFDDGPHPVNTRRLLDELALREIPATFFLVGSRLEGNEALVREMAEAGHQIGVHTWDHVMLSDISAEEFEAQVEQTRAALKELLGEGEYWFRPPYGILDPWLQAREEGPLIIWSVDPEDWKDRDVDRIVNTVLHRVRGGDIILMHDMYAASVDAAVEIADTLLEQGFCFVTVEELLHSAGVTPEAGKRYTSVGE